MKQIQIFLPLQQVNEELDHTLGLEKFSAGSQTDKNKWVVTLHTLASMSLFEWQPLCLTHNISNTDRRNTHSRTSIRSGTTRHPQNYSYGWTDTKTTSDIVQILLSLSRMLRPCPVHLKTDCKKVLSRSALRVQGHLSLYNKQEFIHIDDWLYGCRARPSPYSHQSHHPEEERNKEMRREEQNGNRGVASAGLAIHVFQRPFRRRPKTSFLHPKLNKNRSKFPKIWL